MNALSAALTAFCVSVVAAVALAFPCHGLSAPLAAVSLGLGAAAGIVQYTLYRRKRIAVRRARIGPWEWFVILVGVLSALRAFLWLVYEDNDSLKIISPNNLGDLALHITYTRCIANGVPFWPQNPIYAGIGLHYPLGVDVFNSLLTLLGVPLCAGFVWVGLAGCAATGYAFFRWGRGFALAGFLFNGGLAGFLFFKHLALADYQADLAWKSITLAMFVTQRGLLYAIPAGLVLLWSWRRRFFPEADDDEPPIPFCVEILLYSTMPLFHMHTFIFFSLLCACWVLLVDMPKKIVILKLISWSLVPATLLVICITGFFQSKSIIHHEWDWMYGEQSQFSRWSDGLGLPHFLAVIAGHLACWLVNYGAWPLMIVALAVCLVRHPLEERSRRAVAFVFPSIAIFILSYFVMFAPWAWDNTKLMIWPYFAMLPFLWEHLLAKRNFRLRAAACVLLFLSGFITLLGGIDASHTGYDLATCSELDGVAGAVRQMPATAVFAGFATYNHPLLMNGRIMVEGYSGHLWSHGIDYEGRLAQLDSLMQGEEHWQEIAAQLHVRYIYWGQREQDAYPDSTQPWKTSAARVAQGAWGAIYDLTQPAAKTAPLE